jgi:hypothetical protein
MNRQITTCAFNVALNDGNTTTVVNGFPVNVAVSSGSYTFRPYFHTGSAFDEAINGRLRSQLGGYRFEAVLSWDRLLNSQPLLDLLNNGYTNTNADVEITFFPDASDTNTGQEVVIADTVWAANLESTIVRQPLTISLVGRNVSNTIPSAFKI